VAADEEEDVLLEFAAADGKEVVAQGGGLEGGVPGAGADWWRLLSGALLRCRH
jgi:hypothetical protein